MDAKLTILYSQLVIVRKIAGRYKRLFRSFINEQISSVINFGKKHQRTRNVNANNPTILLAISTTKEYAKKTIPLLLENLHKVGIPKEIIYVFEGGHLENKMTKVDGYNHYILNNNSFDITALIGIVEFNLQSEYWLLLHDTVAFTSSFRNLLYSTNPFGYDCLPLRKSPSMNIGIYSNQFIANNKNYLLDFSNKDYSETALHRMKEKAFMEEDFLFNSTANKKYIHSSLGRFEFIKVVKYFNGHRIMEGYPQLGLLKFKANSPVLIMKDYPELELPKHDPDSLERISWTIDL